MCGIYGFQIVPGNPLSEYESTLISVVLATAMESRGRDSFGGVRFPMKDDEDKTAKVHKSVGKVSEEGIALLRLAAGSKSFLGHTRSATRGSISAENSHPFRMGDVLGVHNGVIQNHEILNKKYDRDFAVDSMHVFAHIDEGKPLAELFGYGTFFWSRCKEDWKRIYFAKTSGGSLCMAKLYRDPKANTTNKSVKHQLIMWASEHSAVQKVAHLLNMAYSSLYIDPDYIHAIENGVVYKLDDKFILGSHWTENKNPRYDYPEGYWDMVGVMEADDDEAPDYSGGRVCHVPAPKDRPKLKAPDDRKISRNQKKFFKKIKKEAKKERWVEDPIPPNLYGGDNLERVFIPVTGQSGETIKHFLCPGCKCTMDDHIWGWCIHNREKGSSCKATGELCEAAVPICSDCGHYLVHGVHRPGALLYSSLIECVKCNTYCAPDCMIMDADGPRKKEETETEEEVDEITEKEPEPDTKVTSLVLSHKYPDPMEELNKNLKRVEEEQEEVRHEFNGGQ